MNVPTAVEQKLARGIGGNRFADSNSNAVQDKVLFLGKVVETVVKCQHVSKGRFIL